MFLNAEFQAYLAKAGCVFFYLLWEIYHATLQKIKKVFISLQYKLYSMSDF